MTDQELFVAIRKRIEDPGLRIDIKTVGTPPLYGPATQNDLDAAGAEFGISRPEHVQRIYLEVENGGFGPGAGILGVADGHTDVDGRNLIESYRALRSQGWPHAILPLSDLADAAWSCIDGRDADGRVLTMYGGRLTSTRFDLFSWLEAWVKNSNMSSEIFEFGERTIINPFSKKPFVARHRTKAKGVPFEP